MFMKAFDKVIKEIETTLLPCYYNWTEAFNDE